MWPDWKGETVAIVGAGPSAKKNNLALLKNIRVLAIKKSFELVPFAEVVYGCDGPWWRSVQGLPNFKGLKLSYDDRVVGVEFGINKVKIPDIKCDRMLFDEIGTVGAGGNSGFQSLNLVLQFGAVRVLLIGFDAFGSYGKEHWYGRNTAWAMNNPDEYNYVRWRKAMTGVADDISSRGVEVVNTSQDSTIKCFKKMSIEEALSHWGLKVAA